MFFVVTLAMLCIVILFTADSYAPPNCCQTPKVVKCNIERSDCRGECATPSGEPINCIGHEHLVAEPPIDYQDVILFTRYGYKECVPVWVTCYRVMDCTMVFVPGSACTLEELPTGNRYYCRNSSVNNCWACEPAIPSSPEMTITWFGSGECGKVGSDPISPDT